MNKILRLSLSVIFCTIILVFCLLMPNQRINAYFCGDNDIPKAECEALVAIYNATDGPNWRYSDGWLLASPPPCGWYGIICADGHVTELYLSGNYMSGELPPELGDLTFLRVLDLNTNYITGIPPEIVNLSELEVLYLAGHRIKSIPPELGQLPKLKMLNMAFGQVLSGSIPSELGNLSELEDLILSYSKLNGRVPPELGKLTNLQSLHIYLTNLEGPLPLSLSKLEQLHAFSFNDTELCEPDIESFHLWLEGIQYLQHSGKYCELEKIYLPHIVH